jgi:hypothetical protein
MSSTAVDGLVGERLGDPPIVAGEGAVAVAEEHVRARAGLVGEREDDVDVLVAVEICGRPAVAVPGERQADVVVATIGSAEEQPLALAGKGRGVESVAGKEDVRPAISLKSATRSLRGWTQVARSERSSDVASRHWPCGSRWRMWRLPGALGGPWSSGVCQRAMGTTTEYAPSWKKSPKAKKDQNQVASATPIACGDGSRTSSIRMCLAFS